MNDFGDLKAVDVRTAWTNERAEFTPWLANNIERLNKALGIELEVENTEVSVGPYYADILAKDTSTGRYVVIENQLEKTNHDHLGKAITYASVLDASAVVWIATDFTEEHKKALDWLNDHTSEDIAFYAIKLELLQIDNSKPAVNLKVISNPLGIIRQAAKSKADGELTENQKLQLEFWTKLREKLSATKAIPSLQTPGGQYWYSISLGKSHVHLSNIVSTEGRAGIRIYISNKIADSMLPFLESHKTEIETELGFTMQWNPNPENMDKIVAIYIPFDIREKDQWEKALNWMVEHTVTCRNIFSKWVKKYTVPLLTNGQN